MKKLLIVPIIPMLALLVIHSPRPILSITYAAFVSTGLGPFGSNIGFKSPTSAAIRSRNSGRKCV
jgi:hypothetical protein